MTAESKSASTNGLRAFSLSDLRQVALLVALFPVALFVPERFWKYPCRGLAFITAQRIFPHTRRLDDYLPGALLRRAGYSRKQYLRSQEARSLEEYLQVLREWTWRWHPFVFVEGQSHLKEALADGRGAILWVSGFESSDLVAKIALHKAGFPAIHLSRPSHGYSTSRFGIRWLNPIRKRVEDRYLRARVVIAGDSAVGALRTLQRKLRENAVVSITVSDNAIIAADVPVLGGVLRISPGPAQLAANTGAALIPVFTTRDAMGRFTVRLGPPIAGGKHAAEVESTLRRYAAQLDDVLNHAPEQWTGWRTGSFSDASSRLK